MNSIQIIGRLTKKPEMKKAGEYDLTKFTLAVGRKVKNANGEYETDFIPCVAWNKQAELVAKLEKGDQLAVCGTLQTREYENQEGEKRTVFEVVINEITFIGNKLESKKPEVETLQEIEEDDLPF